jgi:hypothetical protein
MFRSITLCFTAALVGCPNSGAISPSMDAGNPASDSGSITVDTGAPSRDAGSSGNDAGTQAADTGASTVDAGQSAPDAGTEASDAGRPSVDIADLITCERAMECALVPNQCCYPCGDPQPEQLVAVNGRRTGEANERYCEGHDRNCPRCPQRPIRATLRATCLQSACTLVDLESPVITRCVEESDCVLTLNMCCDTCDPHGADDLIAVRRDQLQTVRQAYCGDRPPNCMACIGTIMPGFSAACIEGACAVRAE